LYLEENLEQDVAQLLPEFIDISFIKGIDGFGSLFEQEGAEGFASLNAIPGAATRPPQEGNEAAETAEGTKSALGWDGMGHR
jgi:hypothetical protein